MLLLGKTKMYIILVTFLPTVVTSVLVLLMLLLLCNNYLHVHVCRFQVAASNVEKKDTYHETVLMWLLMVRLIILAAFLPTVVTNVLVLLMQQEFGADVFLCNVPCHERVS